MEFKASYDTMTRVITAITAAMLLGLPVLLLQNMYVAVLSAAILAVGYALSPRSYTVTPDGIRVQRRLLPEVLAVPRSDLSDARAVQSGDLGATVRVWGSGGLFGYYGRFWSSKCGLSRWFVTDRANLVLLRSASGGVAVVSPDDVAGFLRAVGPVANTTVATSTPPIERPRWPLYAGLGFGAASLGLVALAILWEPGPPAYRFAGNQLEIADRFYPVTLDLAAIDIEHTRILDLRRDEDAGWIPQKRTNGFANSHYRSGWFTVRNGVRVRLYQAEQMPLVLLPSRQSQDPPVLLAPANPEEFLRELRRTR